MLFQSSIRKELARSFGATLVVLVTIVMTIVLIRTLGQASRGFINPQDVMLFMAYSALGRLPTILTLSLFIAMVSTLSRMYRDSEMVVWFTSGQGLAVFLKPLFRFAWPVLLVITLMAIFVWPWANQQTKDMQSRYEQRGDLDRIAPGQFQESSSGNRVFFIDRDLAGEQASNNVFIAATEKGKNSVTTARSGRIETQGDTQFLMLSNGQRLENEIGQSALKISDFEEYGTKTGSSNSFNESLPEPKLLSIKALIKAPTPANLGELAWRIGLALAAINFVILAVALASVNPRGGRSGNMIFVLLTFVVYNNLVNLGQSWILVGLVGFGHLLLAMHGGIFLLGMAWLAKRHTNRVFRLRPRRTQPSPAIGANGSSKS
ncbi:lipopolysaccharide export system permease protein [Polaromonas sp. OV174]|uniref:LPS export ABC transporter permease LptF n=1 Tax=Polaromonas sp. OV174 TaxID=1855300 RepID=UPI0008F2121B|nr:LPS export ABC transporter permease LptF [Polaromonas sp. OV174]SFC55976.1 lipopolysaccharide export system permease protein [Polaromonas sp. OV174]